jgi:MFS family permease
VPFAGAYASLIAFAVVALLVMRGLDIPRPLATHRQGEARSLIAIAVQPTFIVAVLGATVGYAVMNLLMTATPLAMQMCHHPYSEAAFVIEWHVIGMFAPSFFTGSLIQRFGVTRVMFSGAVLMLACIAVAVSGIDVMHFWAALVLLGIGWNFLYIGGTTLLTDTYEPAERAKTQGLNEVFVFSSMALSSALSGFLVTQSGWSTLNYVSLPFIVITALAILWLSAKRRPPLAAGA